MRKTPSLVWLAAITMLAPLAVSIHVPVLPQIGLTLTGTRDGAEPTVSLFLWIFAGGMLATGPLSDRWGRRPILFWGLGIFIAGSLMAALSPSFTVLMIGRGFQALGSAALLIVPRTVVQDCFTPSTRPMAQLAMGQSIGPAVAPFIGGVIGGWLGWRSTFVLLILGAGVLGVLGRRLPETRPSRTIQSRPRAFEYRPIAQLALTAAASSSIYFALLPAAPKVLSVFGSGPQIIGGALVVMATGFAMGSHFAPHLVGKRGRPRAIMIASSGLVFGLTMVIVWPTAIGVGAGLFVYALANGAILPLTIAEGLSLTAHPGRAASILGAIQLSTGALASSGVAWGLPFVVIAAIAAGLTILGATLAWIRPTSTELALPGTIPD